MSIEAPHTTGLFEELLNGAQAVRERPTIIAERDAAKAEAQANADRAQRIAEAHDQANTTIADLNAKVAKLEADLAQATFQHKELGSKLSLVADVLKDVMGNATAAMELVEPPKPEPVVTQDVLQDVASPNASTTTGDGTGGGVDLPGEYPWAHETTASSPASPVQSNQYSTGEAAGSTPSVPFVSTTEPSASSGTGQFPPVVSASSITQTSPTPTSSDAAKSENASSPKPPYSGLAYWERPHELTVDDFVAGGGEVAPWDRRSA